ncbi:MAG: hypothetical protein ACYC0V_17365 [Armatimonadota bacterium]
MKLNKTVIVLLSLLLCMLCVRLVAQDVTPPVPDTITLENKFVKGDTSRYKMVFDMNANIQMEAAGAQQIPPMAVKIVLIMNQKVNKILENGDAEISPKIESLKMTMMGATNEIPLDKAPPITMVMSKTGVIKSITGMDKSFSDMLSGIPMLNAGGSGTQLNIFPDKPVGVGDAWIQDIQNPLGGGMHSECKLLEKDAKAGNYTVAVISQNINGDINFNMKPPTGVTDTPIVLPQMGMSGKYDYKGTNKFSTELGKLISSSGLLSMQIDLNAPSSPGTTAQTIKVLVNGTLQMYIMPLAVTPVKRK